MSQYDFGRSRHCAGRFFCLLVKPALNLLILGTQCRFEIRTV